MSETSLSNLCRMMESFSTEELRAAISIIIEKVKNLSINEKNEEEAQKKKKLLGNLFASADELRLLSNNETRL